jgi:protein phosphatase
LFRRGVAERLTIDHTLARQLVDAGGMTAEEESTSRWSNVLWNVLGGGNGELTAEVRRVDLIPGDSILLCSDGLYRYFSDEELSERISSGSNAQAICRNLICEANERGGNDNITAVVGLFGLENDKADQTMVEAEVPMRQLLHVQSLNDDDDLLSKEHDTLPG